MTQTPDRRDVEHRDMDRWLGDGGMPLLGDLGVTLTAYGVDDDGCGWVEGTWRPSATACNPNGPVQGGVYGVVADAAMTFATLASLARGEHCSLLEMKLSYLRAAGLDDTCGLRATVTRLTGRVAFCEAVVTGADGADCVRATGTNLLRRRSAT